MPQRGLSTTLYRAVLHCPALLSLDVSEYRDKGQRKGQGPASFQTAPKKETDAYFHMPGFQRSMREAVRSFFFFLFSSSAPSALFFEIILKQLSDTACGRRRG